MITYKQLNEYAQGRGYTDWQEFRNDVGNEVADEATKQIKLDMSTQG